MVQQNLKFDANKEDADNRLIAQTSVPTFTANIWRSDWYDCTAHRRVVGNVLSDAALDATQGVTIQQSFATSAPTNGADGDASAHVWTEFTTSQQTLVTGESYYAPGSGYSVECLGNYVRLVVKHNGAAPTTFSAYLIGVGIT